MKNQLLYPVVFVSFLMLPLAFNSCQKGFDTAGSGGKGSKASSNDTVEEEVNLREKYCSDVSDSPDMSSKLAPNRKGLFVEKKVHVDLKKAKVQQKISQSTEVSLTVLVNNQCLDIQNLPKNSLSRIVSAGKRRIPKIETQAYTYQLPAAVSIENLETEAQADPCIRGVALNSSYEAQSIKTQFNDVLKTELAHLETIQAAKAYEILFNSQGGIPKKAAQSAQKEVQFAVIDTGVDVNHPDLVDNIWKFTLPDSPDEIFSGIDATKLEAEVQNYNPFDPTGHGTHIAGLIAATANNNLGVLGVMPYRAQIMAIKASSPLLNNAMDTTSIINGMRWATVQGADVINLSHGERHDGPGFNAAYLDVILEVIEAGVTVVTVAGNDVNGNTKLDGETQTIIPGIYGASHEGIITVGSSNVETKSLSHFSLRSPEFVEIAAPGSQENDLGAGSGLLSTIPEALTASQDHYTFREGTSMAAGVVSASAGLTIAWIREKTGVTPHPCVVEGVIKESAERVAELEPHVQQGRHLDLLNMATLLKKLWP